jgi:hypothetical protein
MWNARGRAAAVKVAAVFALGAGCAGTRAGAHATNGPPASDQQLFPMLLTARTAQSGDVRAANLRVWADQEYRARNPQWQEELDDHVAYTNRVLIPMLGVGLVAEYRAWDHGGHDSDLAAKLAALIQTDPGDDVVWVVGVTSGDGETSASFERLGTMDSGHVVMRGYAEGEQRAALQRAFPEASADERGHAMVARRRHQIASVLLHQLAHSLGALHETEPHGIMSASYSPAAEASIGDDNHRRMRSVLDERLAAAAQHHEAERLLDGGDAAGAAVALAPVLRLYPARVKPRVLHCRIQLAQGDAQDAETIAACDAAAAIGVESAVAVAMAQWRADDVAGARRTLALAEDRLTGIASDKAAAAWLVMAGAYRELSALTRAENALARAAAPPDHGIATWVATTRARYGIPRDAMRWNLTVDDEGMAVAAVRNAIARVNMSDWAAAANEISGAERRWPSLPGALTARCALDYRRDAIAAARRSCKRALAQGGSSWALYLLGTMELEAPRGARAAGIAHLRQAIARDPDLVQAWRKLARALSKAKARSTAELEQLRSDYRARFHAALPD